MQELRDKPTKKNTPTAATVEVLNLIARLMDRNFKMESIVLDKVSQGNSVATEAVVRDLRHLIENMDALSQEGFSQIEAIAGLALEAMRASSSSATISLVYNALRAIKGKAQDIQDCINSEAESVGCNSVDHDSPAYALNHHVEGA